MTDARPEILHPADDVCVAVIALDGPRAPVPALLVWDERHGWRTALSRRHPLGRGAVWPWPQAGCVTSPATEGGFTPDAGTLVFAVRQWPGSALGHVPVAEGARY
ncbi:hypothetical protein [Streptomyces sp. NPDC001665]